MKRLLAAAGVWLVVRRVRATENEDKGEGNKGNSGQVSRHGQSVHPKLVWRLVAFVLVRASIDEVADQAEQRERDHDDDADDKRKIQAVTTA